MARLVITIPSEVPRETAMVIPRELDASNTIGRGPQNSIQILDRQASKEHFRIDRRAEGWVLRDLGSMNGTWMSGRRVSEVRIFDGDEIRIGSVTIRFEDPGGPSRPFAVAELNGSVAHGGASEYQLRPSTPAPAAHGGAPPLRMVEGPRVARLARFYDLAVALAQVRDVAEVLALVGNRVSEGAELLRAALYVLDDVDGDAGGEGGGLELRAYATWTRVDVADLPAISDNAVDHVLTERAALLMHRAPGSLRGPSASGVGLPLFAGDDPLGVLWLDARGFWDLKPDDLDYLMTVGQQVARSVETLLLRDRLAARRQLQ